MSPCNLCDPHGRDSNLTSRSICLNIKTIQGVAHGTCHNSETNQQHMTHVFKTVPSSGTALVLTRSMTSTSILWRRPARTTKRIHVLVIPKLIKSHIFTQSITAITCWRSALCPLSLSRRLLQRTRQPSHIVRNKIPATC